MSLRRGVDERFKQSHGVWIVRTDDDVAQGGLGLYALIAVCTHLGCTPNYLAAEAKFKCPCHGSGFRLVPVERHQLLRTGRRGRWNAPPSRSPMTGRS